METGRRAILAAGLIGFLFVSAIPLGALDGGPVHGVGLGLLRGWSLMAMLSVAVASGVASSLVAGRARLLSAALALILSLMMSAAFIEVYVWGASQFGAQGLSSGSAGLGWLVLGPFSLVIAPVTGALFSHSTRDPEIDP